MNIESTSLPGGRFGGEGLRSLKGSDDIAVKYARLQGYLEGYLDQMSASKDAQEELISKLLSELADILNPISSSGRAE
ncbi:MAG: hypothetical protein SFT81_05875 [Candidatus Caenarcaniphilales bacterium]|nr:hypothetical protein [Candidatus Caenarcaniphilales bacterium]